MHQVNIHEAKTNLSKLIEEAANGEPFIIAKAGKPLVIVKRINAPQTMQRLDFLAGQFTVPQDFDSMGQKDIEQLFGTEK